MDDAALNVGYAVIDTCITAAVFVALIAASIKWLWIARLCKIAFLAAWGLLVGVAPLYAVAISWDTGRLLSSALGAILFAGIGWTTYYYLGFPHLKRSLLRQD